MYSENIAVMSNISRIIKNMSMNYTYYDDYSLYDFQVSTGLVALLSMLYGSISLIAIIGNTLIIIVIAKNRAMHTVTNFFIANLSIADVIVGLFSIPFQFQAALLQRWDLPSVLCQLAPFVKELSVNVSVFTLVVISIDRFFAVIHPLKQLFTKRSAKAIMAVVWFISLMSASPTVVAFSVELHADNYRLGTMKPFCVANYPRVFGIDLRYVYSIYLVLVQYFVPLSIISYAYARIIHRIWLSKAPGAAMDSRDQIMQRNKKKVIKMLIIVVALFALCWLPLQTYNLLSEIYEINEYAYIHIIWFCSNWLAMSNSCYNPFIYGLLNEKFKRGIERLFCPNVPPKTHRQASASERCTDGMESLRLKVVRGKPPALRGSPGTRLGGLGVNVYNECRDFTDKYNIKTNSDEFNIDKEGVELL